MLIKFYDTFRLLQKYENTAVILKKTITFNWLNRIRRRQRKQIDDQKAILHSQIKAIQGQISEKSTDLLDKKIVDSVEKVGKIYFASIIPRANALKRESEEH